MRNGLSTMAGWLLVSAMTTRALAMLAGINLLILVVIVAAAVVLRYVFSNPIVGVNEIVQFVSVAVVMLALPWCTEQNAHVRADVLDEAIGRYGRLLGDVVSRALSIIVLAMLAQRGWAKMFNSLEFGDKGNMLGLPVWPLYGMLTLGVALAIPVLAIQIAAVILEDRKVRS